MPDVLVRGEDWAEKISYEIAKLMSVPAAETKLATVVRLRTPERLYGSMSRDMRPRAWAWTPGAALLAERDDEFDAKSCRGHSIAPFATPWTDSEVRWEPSTPIGPHSTFAGYPCSTLGSRTLTGTHTTGVCCKILGRRCVPRAEL